MDTSARQRFLSYVRSPKGARPIVSPFLPDVEVVKQTLRCLGLPATEDTVSNEIVLSHALDYEPVFLTECTTLIFPWEVDENKSDEKCEVSFIDTSKGPWIRAVPKIEGLWGNDSGFPVKTEADHEMLVIVCEEIGKRETELRRYFREWRGRVGEDGVIVIGHPHASWLGYQINQQNIFLHWHDYQDTYRRSMEAIYRASLVVMEIAMQEGIDFMSDSSYGLEMTSPSLFEVMDLPYVQGFSAWTHERGGLFWYHSCSQTRKLIVDGTFNRLGADVIETIAPPPEGDNDLAESRRCLDPTICTKGNLSLGLLRDGTPEQISRETRRIAEAVGGYAHIFSTADAVLPGTPPENLIAFVTTARQIAESP